MEKDGQKPRPPLDLRERNRLWAELRSLDAAGQGPGDPDFESALAALQALIRWPRERVLAGLGLRAESAPQAG